MTTSRMPSWLRRPPASCSSTYELKQLLRRTALNTVCEEARCPNVSECFARRTAAFMILGDVCTRGCGFCSVKTGRPLMHPKDFAAEGSRVAAAAKELGLKYVVITSVTRDDLPDGGASGFVETIKAIRSCSPETFVEVLIPDFGGCSEALQLVLDAKPDVLNHNLETVSRLYKNVRPGARYERSLELLKTAKERSPALLTKTGIMLGLGEQREEVLDLMRDCREALVESFTAGQYMQPTSRHLEVARYLELEEFSYLEQQAQQLGFPHVAVGPLVRSSYHADSIDGLLKNSPMSAGSVNERGSQGKEVDCL